MNSLEALRTILINCKNLLVDENHNIVKLEDLVKIIKQDLERLEMFEQNYDTTVRRNKELIEENEKLNQALDKACKRLDYTCPVEEELIEDLDCENCKDNYKECWKKFFERGARQ